MCGYNLIYVYSYSYSGHFDTHALWSIVYVAITKGVKLMINNSSAWSMVLI